VREAEAVTDRPHRRGEAPGTDRRKVETAFAVLRDYLAPAGPGTPTDAILCFGCFGTNVPRRAAAAFHAGLAPVVVVTGRGPAWRRETEADAFARVLLDAGVPDDRIVREHRAVNIGDNVVLGLAAARHHGLDVESVTVVAHVHGIRRCLATLGRHAPDVAAFPSPLPAAGPVSARKVADALGELRRLRLYPALGYITPQAEPPAVTRVADYLARAIGTSLDHHPTRSRETS
jgi:hypothetical protein